MAGEDGDQTNEVSTRAEAAASARLREAFLALVRGAKAERMYLGSAATEMNAAHARFHLAFLRGVREALEELPVLILVVSPAGIQLGNFVVLEATDSRGDVVESLFSAGLRRFYIEVGAADEELAAMGRLLLTPWGTMGDEDEDLSAAVWHADFAHVYFDVMDALADRENEEVGDSPIVRELAGLVLELNAQAKGSADGELARLRQDELAVFLGVKDTVEFRTVGREDARVRLEGNFSSQLAGELQALREDRDMATSDVVGLLATCINAAVESDRARMIGEAWFTFVVNAALVQRGTSALILRTAELLDEDLTPNLAHRDIVRAASGMLAQEPTRGRLVRLFATSEQKEVTGLAFTLFNLLPGEAEAVTLADVLPVWATRVLADTLLLRCVAESVAAVELATRFMALSERGGILLGLMMAARHSDPRLIEPLLGHVGDATEEVREAALVALRQYQTPRIREAVRTALGDSTERVRVEALRYCVAYRDVGAFPLLETRIDSTEVGSASDAELRALCIAIGRIHGAQSLPLLSALAQGAHPARHPQLPRFALHGMRAVNSDAARTAMTRAARLVPALAAEVDALMQVQR